MSYTRTVRRAAERKSVKEARKTAGSPYPANLDATATGSTGPRTAQGKAKSSLNNLRHGLTGQFCVLDYELQDDFDNVLEALREEHAPITPPEDILVAHLAEHAWLSRRAQTLQDAAIIGNSPHNLGLFLRYQTANDRGFHRCLNELSKLRKERRTAEHEFESQSARQPEEFVSQNSEKAEKKHQSAIVGELRSLLGDDSPASEEDLMTLFRGSAMHCCMIMRQKAAA
jgi:hypothetical protein